MMKSPALANRCVMTSLQTIKPKLWTWKKATGSGGKPEGGRCQTALRRPATIQRNLKRTCGKEGLVTWRPRRLSRKSVTVTRYAKRPKKSARATALWALQRFNAWLKFYERERRWQRRV